MIRLIISTDNILDNEVDDGEGQYTDYETDETVEDGIFGFLNFASITGGGHIVNTADNHDDDTD